MSDPSDTSLSIAAFTALGTIVGYLGAEVCSSSSFSRLLWPSRYFNSASLSSLLRTALLMPMGGPIHKAAVEAPQRAHRRRPVGRLLPWRHARLGLLSRLRLALCRSRR